MSQQPATSENKVGKCMLSNWVEERAVAALGTEEAKAEIKRHGHKGVLTVDQESQMETVTTFREAYIHPKTPGVKQRGIRDRLLEEHVARMIREEIEAAQKSPSPKTDFSSTTQADFCVQGFVPLIPEGTQVHDYKTDQAISFWSENRQRVQGATAIETLKAPFRKSALFSTPISERLDEMDLPPDN